MFSNSFHILSDCFHSKSKASNWKGQVHELEIYIYVCIYIILYICYHNYIFYIYTSYPPANSCPDVSFRIEQRRNFSRHEALTSGLANARSRLWAGQKLRWFPRRFPPLRWGNGHKRPDVTDLTWVKQHLVIKPTKQQYFWRELCLRGGHGMMMYDGYASKCYRLRFLGTLRRKETCWCCLIGHAICVDI